jgi:HSP20 family molecular chaperone IbpA
MAGQVQALPVRVYEAGVKIMVAAPMPGLAPDDIAVTIDGDRVRIRGAQRGPRQNQIRLAAAEWTVGPYDRELRLSRPVSGALANVTLGNGVLVLAMPTTTSGEPDAATEITLETVEAARGERVGHVGRRPRPTTTTEHRSAKHAA